METVITIFYIAVCVLLFALAILIHEFGHFIVALKLGLRVEAFSIGFGPVLWKRKVNGVEYRISAIPLGGYVSLPDVDPEGTKALEGASEKGKAKSAKEEDAPRNRIPAWKEILVAVAGPLMNIVLAAVLAIALACIPGAKFGELTTVISGVMDDAPAAKAGLIAGDRILSVGGHPVSNWTEMMTEVQITGGKPAEFAFERGAETNVVVMSAKQDEVTGAYFIGAIRENSERLGHFMPCRSPFGQLMWDAGSIFRVLKGLLTPKEAKATSKALGGPVMIAEGLYRQVRANPLDGIGFLRFINMNLAVLNLLPIPVLDGGLIMFALFALVFRRRVPDCIVKYLSMAFMVLLMGLMGLLIWRDGMRSWRIHTYKGGEDAGSVEKVEMTNGTDNATGQAR